MIRQFDELSGAVETKKGIEVWIKGFYVIGGFFVLEVIMQRILRERYENYRKDGEPFELSKDERKLIKEELLTMLRSLEVGEGK